MLSTSRLLQGFGTYAIRVPLQALTYCSACLSVLQPLPASRTASAQSSRLLQHKQPPDSSSSTACQHSLSGCMPSALAAAASTYALLQKHWTSSCGLQWVWLVLEGSRVALIWE
jgi:hypothetical protein